MYQNLKVSCHIKELGLINMKGLSLFANVGIAETYLEELGLDIVVANELLENRCKFYKHCHPNTEVICGDITNDNILINQYPKMLIL